TDLFDASRIKLADTDGTGTTDIAYLGSEGVTLYFNQSGNSWSDRVLLPQAPVIEQADDAQVVDLLGAGTACLVWSSRNPVEAGQSMHYIDLM
ncbi:hypothetical protein, partial [Salmonella sp. SAL4434]|uniref:hypothetical protein n=1 Tax=Salmonella sp. SAL4434 TaxID=3159889 RepID=UPI00397B1751